MVDAMASIAVAGRERKTARREGKQDVGGIEIEAEGITIRVGRGGDPLAYLIDVLTRIVNGHSNRDIDQLLPWAYQAQAFKAVA